MVPAAWFRLRQAAESSNNDSRLHAANGDLHPPVLGATLGRGVVSDGVGLPVPQQRHAVHADALLLETPAENFATDF